LASEKSPDAVEKYSHEAPTPLHGNDEIQWGNELVLAVNALVATAAGFSYGCQVR
jgi:hypothetical protein